jgi:hypothetical protein
MTLLRPRTVARVGVRTLLVAGFAGGVWLLSSAAAHAAAPTTSAGSIAAGSVGAHPAPIGSIVGSTVDSAARPALSLLGQVLTPTTKLPVHPTVRSAATPVIRTLVPPAASQAERAEHPTALSQLISSVAGLVRPLTGTTQRASAPLTDLLAFPAAPQQSRVLAIARDSSVPRGEAHAVVPAGAVPDCATTVAGDGAHQMTRVRPAAGTAVEASPVVHRYAVSGTATVPHHPERAPLPVYPDSGTHGISTTASGSSHDAGGYAVVTAAAEPGQPAGVHGLCATEVAVRPMLADAPTFAPD